MSCAHCQTILRKLHNLMIIERSLWYTFTGTSKHSKAQSNPPNWPLFDYRINVFRLKVEGLCVVRSAPEFASILPSGWDRLGRKMGFEEHNRLLNNCVCLCVVIKCEGPIEWYQQNLVQKGTSCRIWFGKKKKINVTTNVRSWTTRRAKNKNSNNNETFSLRINTNNVQLHPIQGHLSLSQFHMSNSTSRYYWLILPCRAWNYTLHKHTQTDERTNRSALIEA